MANEIGIQITATNAGAGQVMASAAQEAQGLASSVKGVGDTAHGILAANTIQGLGSAVGAFASQAVAAGDEILSTSQKMGVSTDALQEMRFWAEQGGVSAAGLERAVATLNQRVGEAAAGNQTYAAAFQQLGVEVTDAGGNIRDTESVMKDTITALREIEDPAARAAAASELFGSRLGRELLPALDASSMSMEDAAARARELGIVMDQDAVEASDQFADSLSALQQAGAGILRDFLIPVVEFMGSQILPVLGDVAAGFRDLPGPVTAVGAAIGVVSMAALLVAPRLLAARSAMVAFGLSTTAANRALGALGVALAAITATLAVMGSAGNTTAGDVAGLTEDVERLVATGRMTGELRDAFGEGAAGVDEFRDKLDVATASWFDWSDNLNRTFGDINASKQAFADLDAAMAALVTEGANADQVLRQVAEAYQLNDEEVQQLLTVLPQFQDAQERVTDRTTDAAEATEQQIDAIKALADAVRAQTDPLFAFAQAQEQVKAAQEAANEALDRFGRNSPQYQAAAQELADRELDLFYATTDAGEAIDSSLLPQLRRMREAGVLSEGAFRALLEMIEQVDQQNVDIRVRDDANLARARAEALDRAIRNVDRFVDITFRYHQDGGAAPVGSMNVPTRAHGGVVGSAATGGVRGNRVLVGEMGPEIVDLAPGSLVHTAGASAAMMAGGVGPIVVEVHVHAGSDQVLRAIAEGLSFKVRTEAGGDADVFFGGGG